VDIVTNKIETVMCFVVYRVAMKRIVMSTQALT